MPRFIRFFCCVRCAYAGICPLLLLCPLCLGLGSVGCFYRCKLLRIIRSIINGKLTNLRRLEAMFLSLCLLCLCLGSSAFYAMSAVLVPEFVCFFCYVRSTNAWVCLLLLLRPLCLYLGLSASFAASAIPVPGFVRFFCYVSYTSTWVPSFAFTIVSCSQLPDLSFTENKQI